MWVIEQIGYPNLPPLVDEMRNQATIHTATYQDTLSTQANAVVNLSAVEIGAKLSTRMYTLLSDSSRDFKTANEGHRSTAAVEIARSYVTRHKHYGRLGVEFVEFFPSLWRFIRLGISTGILAENDLYLRANISLFRKLSHESADSHMYHASMELGRLFVRERTEWRFGGALGWSYRTTEAPDDASHLGYAEHMLFTLSPFAEYSNRTIYLRGFVNFRLWLDKEIFQGPSLSAANESALRIHYPSVISYPDVGIALSLVI